jgi:hypothetical protein
VTDAGRVPQATEPGRLWDWIVRALGLLLLVLTLTPVYRVLSHPRTGSFGEGAVIRGDTSLEAAWWGILLVLVAGFVLALLLPTARIRRRLETAADRLASIPTSVFSLGMALLSLSLSALASRVVFKGYPTLVDGMAALLHGRILASGSAALPLPEPHAAYLIPNTLMTAEGWVSQYPPFHPFLLAVGHALGSAWLVGPILVGLTAGLTVLVADLLLPVERVAARMGGTLVALSPFLIFLGGGYLSHVPAAAFAALSVYMALRARAGHWGWAVGTGASCGALVTTRPWLGLVVGIAFAAGLWLHEAVRRRSGPWLLGRMGAATAGGLPFAIALGLYNHRLFGHPLRLGYSLAYGPAHDLGFHRDPWGNWYGPMEALGYSAVNLLNLGVYLLETPAPALALVGLYLFTTRRHGSGSGTLLAWALLPAVANLAYWHHGFHLGPRMLYESAPAWCLLTALAAVCLARGGTSTESGDGPEAGDVPPTRDGSSRSPLHARLHPKDVLLWALLVSLLGPLVLIPLRAESYRWSEETLARLSLPEPPDPETSLVFVHGSWGERIVSRLHGAGMRLDSIETALRRNDVCRLHGFAEAYARRVGDLAHTDPEIDFRPLPSTPASLVPLVLSEGNRVWVDTTSAFSTDCQREARSDRLGVISLAPLLWQGDLPGIERGRPLLVRDLGPEENLATLRAFPGRRPFVLYLPASGWAPVLRPYDEGMEVLWRQGSRPVSGQLESEEAVLRRSDSP